MSVIPGAEHLPADSRAVTREYTLLLVRSSAAFLPEFHAWLAENYHVWERFRQEADKIRFAGWERYSARTIIEVLRHESNLREASGRWKLNNCFTPDMARLYLVTTPATTGFFELRGRCV